jgi:nitric oxide reductase NorQ protein
MVTQNPISRENRGTNPVNRANLGRFRSVHCPYLDTEDEVNLLDSKHNDGRTKVKRETLRNLVEAANKTRNESNGPTLSTRDLEAIVADVDTGVDPLTAIRSRLHHLQLSQPYNDPEAAWDLITPVFN